MSSNIQGQASAGESATGIPPTSSHRSNNIPSNVTIGGRLDQGVQNTSSGIGTMTITEISAATATTTTTTTNEDEDEVIPLNLRARGNVRWNEDVIDNEGLGRKSSKRCCIFHKQRSFGESSTDSENDDDDGSVGSGSSSSSGGPPKKPARKIARPKQQGDKVPNFQRYHA
mmetsp:Transcript_19947/g.30191  ORF Transcript_19947/g.30191 Transcript_19947/m.30191 type:complete len:171 (-) Transcript_19947:292-804(-)|eukprot:CAMPEP_0194082074 /NCGR_PEP_ID=MMETSP0149-20130528/7687_1 /TAXON_ID=122233 /ORGANISM="Chaetoceros debilis, Strain MM31A-1" /LENGTH=170 /DNA_ID=CAMNT_0038764137 /DNA_START=126 /DNA_END=638 /DNA_ORIENTATION=-